MFLLLTDYQATISANELNAISQNSTTNRQKAEAYAIDMAKKQIGRKYDAQALLAPFALYNPGGSYLIGDRVYTDDGNGNIELYTCTQAGTGVNIADANYFSPGDPRDPTLVNHLISYAIYKMATSIAKRQVSEDRYTQYQEAKEFFEAVRQDLIYTGWPTLKTDAGDDLNPPIFFTSNTKLHHNW